MPMPNPVPMPNPIPMPMPMPMPMPNPNPIPIPNPNPIPIPIPIPIYSIVRSSRRYGKRSLPTDFSRIFATPNPISTIKIHWSAKNGSPG
jgi:hypothetical protein